MKNGADSRAGVLDVHIEIPGADAAIADKRSTQIQLPDDSQAVGLDGLRQELAQDDLLGEVLGTHDDRVVARPCVPGAGQNGDQEHARCRHWRDDDGPAVHRPDAPLQPGDRGVGRQRERRGRNGACQNRCRVDHRQPAEDVLAQAAGADGRRDRGSAHTNDRRDANAGDDGR